VHRLAFDLQEKRNELRHVVNTRISHAQPLSIIGPGPVFCNIIRESTRLPQQKDQQSGQGRDLELTNQSPRAGLFTRRLDSFDILHLFLILHLLQTFHRNLQSPLISGPPFYARNDFEYAKKDTYHGRVWDAYVRPAPHIPGDATATRSHSQVNIHICLGP
jgi:hypothetical protein